MNLLKLTLQSPLRYDSSGIKLYILLSNVVKYAQSKFGGRNIEYNVAQYQLIERFCEKYKKQCGAVSTDRKFVGRVSGLQCSAVSCNKSFEVINNCTPFHHTS